jgi:drug/metabolite transporter (DMT)-like permease
MQTKTLKSDSLLLVAAFLWGTTFVAQRMGMEHIGPMTYNAVRFALGALTLVPVLVLLPPPAPADHSPHSTRFLLCGGGLVGLALFGGASMQQMGLLYTSASKAAFVTNLYVMLVPILGLFLGQRCGLPVWGGAILSMAGLCLLSKSFALGQGDQLVLIGAFFWAIHVHLIAYFAKRANPLHIACLQFLVCATLSLLAAFFFEPIALPAIRAATIPILYGGILSAGVAFTLQVVCQRTSPPSHAAIVMSFETVFAALAGYAILHERLGPRDLAGCALMFTGLLVVQLPLLLGSPTTAETARVERA